ncbi:helix-turn-helix domain-containing protein [Bacillus sp. BP-3]
MKPYAARQLGMSRVNLYKKMKKL